MERIYLLPIVAVAFYILYWAANEYKEKLDHDKEVAAFNRAIQDGRLAKLARHNPNKYGSMCLGDACSMTVDDFMASRRGCKYQ